MRLRVDLWIAGIVLAISGGPLPTALAAERPNILLIVVDDQSPSDFRFYNPAATLDAPVIERLAAEGMVLDAAYHMGSFSGAVCTPSRHMLMSGRTVWHLPIHPAVLHHQKKQLLPEPRPVQGPLNQYGVFFPGYTNRQYESFYDQRHILHVPQSRSDSQRKS